MIMLTQDQLELIHAEVDGQNTAEQSAEVRQLIESQPEARSLMTSLRSLDAVLSTVADRAPSPRL
jgi:anti-sigma factor RsiW